MLFPALLVCRGTVADAVVMDRKGYGFVTFADPKDAMTFLEVGVVPAAGAVLGSVAALGMEDDSADCGSCLCTMCEGGAIANATKAAANPPACD